MNKYELTLLFPEEQEGKTKKRVIKMVTDYVTKNKGKVVNQDSWGVKPLAYPIGKNTTGEYEYMEIELDPKHQPKLENNVRLEESLLRYLFIRV